jgi:tetratricopeptide (TPR) repeat protein
VSRASGLGVCDSAAAVLMMAAVLAPLSAYAADSSLTAANAALQAGRADEAASMLNDALKANAKDAEANNLLCRVEYATQHFDQAATHCEKAVSFEPNNARYHLWLGRAIGERAEHASFMSAFSLAKKAREQFEKAVQLDPHDAEALSDVGEFYKEAPGVVGGGTDKANDIAGKLEAVDPVRAHLLRGAIAEKAKDLTTAEREFKAAASGNHAAVAWMELASFYRRHERWSEMEAAVKSGENAAARDKREAVALFNGASTLARVNRQPDVAIKLYEEYLASPGKTEEAPAFDALTRLARLRKQTGDQAGAERERSAALALAHDYKPAQEALQDSKH